MLCTCSSHGFILDLGVGSVFDIHMNEPDQVLCILGHPRTSLAQYFESMTPLHSRLMTAQAHRIQFGNKSNIFEFLVAGPPTWASGARALERNIHPHHKHTWFPHGLLSTFWGSRFEPWNKDSLVPSYCGLTGLLPRLTRLFPAPRLSRRSPHKATMANCIITCHT